ncbi:MAG: UDP-3-O-[3-hydroxymyristoyl] N-acetylglucosamine deacetylase [Flavobacteriales bacterium]|nr:UDP-3-O-[3-hydroxymyristoyl] N-acetylglucosamine deacetylase [Flavobacteriales bacterium]|tara:strand:- start:550 stop:1938 length:1389 start_codon:yes stop_codon:yes gene_type:complete
MKQKTIKDIIKISGFGIHTGVKTNVILKPAKEDNGIVFIRSDIESKPKIKALVQNVFSTERSTNLKQNNAEIRTVEHLLAAIAGSEIDNLDIEVDNIEIPILDGSSKKYSELISKIGTVNQNKEKKIFEIKRRISIVDKDTGTQLIATPADEYQLEVEIDFDSKALKKQKAHLNSIIEFNSEISSSRTFCFFNELETLIEKDLIKGGDLKNAIVIAEKNINKNKLQKISKLFKKENLSVSNEGILNNLTLRYENEPARHKLLDVIGDLSLLGVAIKGKIQAIKPGHKNNTNFAKYLSTIMNEEMKKTAPIIDFSKKPLFDKEKIKTILPHRKPFLFIDEIREIGEDYIIGVKFVKKEEDYFEGHFPQEPVMPGVLQLETMAQAGGVLILSKEKNPENFLTFFMKIDNAKFKKKVVPGDNLIFRLNLISPIRRGLCHMHGKGFVNGQIVVEADLLAQISPKNI